MKFHDGSFVIVTDRPPDALLTLGSPRLTPGSSSLTLAHPRSPNAQSLLARIYPKPFAQK